ncbi:MAG: hypothetical protein LWY06_00615 [Firmicutes bacterium]|nr:hypothetical protein [Bacillota bacterium]
MDDDKLSEKIRKELEEIAIRKGHLLGERSPENQVSLKIIDEFLKCNNDKLVINKNLMSLLLLISNHLISESMNQIFRDLKKKPDDMLILRIYLYMQMSSNFLDGFLLGHSFLKSTTGLNILEYRNLDVLEIFKQIYLIRMQQKEAAIIKAIDNETKLISHFEKAYEDLFLTNSVLLNDLSAGNSQTIVKYLMLTFFDGILVSRIISDFMDTEKEQEEQ